VVGDLLEAQDYGIAVAQGNDDLVAAMNDALAEMIDDGTYSDIYEEWFGSEPEWLDELADSQVGWSAALARLGEPQASSGLPQKPERQERSLERKVRE